MTSMNGTRWVFIEGERAPREQGWRGEYLSDINLGLSWFELS